MWFFLRGYFAFCLLWLTAWGFAFYVGICDLLLAWVFALLKRGYLRLRAVFLRFARGVNVNDRQLAVNASQWFLACFARYGRQWFLSGLCANAR